LYNITYEDTIDAVETTIEVRICYAFRHLAPLVMFTDTLYSKDFQDILSTNILPFIREKLTFYHRFFMDNDPKYTRRLTQRFIF